MRALLLCLALAACGRPLTPTEAAFLADLQGPTLDASRIRLADGLAPQHPRTVRTPPRVTCQSRLYPPRPPTVRVTNGAVTAFETVFLRGDLYRDDMVEGFPAVLPLEDAMLLAHEAVHVWQWQNRDLTGYHPLKAAFEHVRSADPYLFDTETARDFLDYGYEQQGAIMEEYVCCRALAPQAARTERLHAMLSAYFPLRPLDEPLSDAVLLPWRGAAVEGICDGPDDPPGGTPGAARQGRSAP